MNILRNLQIVKNNRQKCLLGKFFVHTMNIVLWVTLFYVVFVVVFVPAEPVRKFYGILCIMGLFADFLFMTTAEPVLANPFKKAPQVVDKAPEEAIKEIIKAEPDIEASLKKAMAAGKDNSSEINHSIVICLRIPSNHQPSHMLPLIVQKCQNVRATPFLETISVVAGQN